MKINIHDKFYRYIEMVGIFEYVVKGIRQYKEEQFFELECQSCNHGWKCMLLCGFDDYGKLQYIRMINNLENNDQRHFHTHSGQFFSSKKEALINKGKKMREYIDEEIKKAKDTVLRLENQKQKEIKFIEDLINTFQ